MLMQEAVNDFTDTLARNGRSSPATVAAYHRDLQGWLHFMQSRGHQDIAHIQPGDLRAYLMAERSRGVAVRSLRRRFAALRALYRHLQKASPDLSNPVQGIMMPKSEQRLPDWLTVDQAKQLMDPVKKPSTAPNFAQSRDQLILELLYSSALRVSELAGLDLQDLDRHGGTVRVMGKGSKERIVPAGKTVWRMLDLYLPLRHALLMDKHLLEENALLLNAAGHRLSVRSIQIRIKEMGEKRLGQHIHPHTLRHSAASHFLQSAGDLRAVQEYLGHAGIATTAIYTHMDYQQLAHVYDAAHPRARHTKRPETEDKL
ncbi:tyrosine recombinase XerC [Acidithiobacillus thiooxidans]|jgi:integrase/recombinase XerC|uniref:Tyrosine recombinase XerC n=1 Tax=Acidithiobacillus thiooxidans ATCC 19377 TaxID=637390 RepID=A0A5P9XUC9_ACITH|nr:MULTISPECIES: tyrosine recombinase XerC [Acidithiobacillus]MBU2740450.1 tyrosine recombinase XerC [Acidithiobacillus albertensis]MBU2834492.1 tyrosine recombinase XerC [Acidithiobacillus thiooxidans]MBU2841171.1 tyrosine recombinase XerC [Acidithiobacillus thiooxidans]MDA8175831.1 tyrosine recombinase XerC [Acidithiobacillus sp.]QFX97432.1 integrase [Acidithiobacillus thiooxidans ATCC 19377]